MPRGEFRLGMARRLRDENDGCFPLGMPVCNVISVVLNSNDVFRGVRGKQECDQGRSNLGKSDKEEEGGVQVSYERARSAIPGSTFLDQGNAV